MPFSSMLVISAMGRGATRPTKSLEAAPGFFLRSKFIGLSFSSGVSDIRAIHDAVDWALPINSVGAVTRRECSAQSVLDLNSSKDEGPTWYKMCRFKAGASI